MKAHRVAVDDAFFCEAELSSRFYSLDESHENSPRRLSSCNMSIIKNVGRKMLSRASYAGLPSEGPLNSTLIYPQHSTPQKRTSKYHSRLQAYSRRDISCGQQKLDFLSQGGREPEVSHEERSIKQNRPTRRLMVKRVISSRIASMFDSTEYSSQEIRPSDYSPFTDDTVE